MASAFLRVTQHQRIPVPERDTWVTSDADTFYHLRRVDRMIVEGRIDGRDDALSFPHGSAIPWPPYYTAVVGALTAPFAPNDPDARRDFVERRVSSLPMGFGVLTSLLAVLAGAAVGGRGAALLAGLLHAASAASIVYSRVGNGDHHAFISLLAASTLLLLSRALREDTLADPRATLRWGVAAGVAAGVALGSWVASVLYVIPVQLVLGWLVIEHGRRPIPGLAALGLGFHAAALLALLPATLLSPWAPTEPWMVVNLAWFHPAWLLVGGLVFVPLLRPMDRAARGRYPWVVAGSLIGLVTLLFVTNLGPAAGIREGFDWMARNDEFMGAVWESRGIFGEGAAFDPFDILGHGAIVLPFAWLALAWFAFRRGRRDLLPWAVAVPLLAMQAIRQVRFVDALTLPMAVTLAWAVVALWRWRTKSKGKRTRPFPEGALAIGILGFAVVANLGTVSRTRAALARSPEAPGQDEHQSAMVARELADWIRSNTAAEPRTAVMASWTWGHLVEWAADRPSVATNFGTFVGEEAFRAPSRFFLEEDPVAAERVLASRQARWILITSWLPNTLNHMVRAAAPERAGRYLEPGPASEEQVRIRFPWYRTMGARMLFEGRTVLESGGFGAPIDFARIVHVSSERDARYSMRPDPAPAGWVWELVPGARLEVPGPVGSVLEIGLVVRYPSAQHEVVWQRSVRVDDDGIARVRLPYATDEANGDGVAAGPARWRLDGREGELVIPASAVLGGETLRVE